jgi:hypothetical protein
LDTGLLAALRDVTASQLQKDRTTERTAWGPQDLRGLRQLQAAVGDKFVQGLVLHDHDRITPFDEKLHAAPVSMLWQG